ncbi:MAG TPA: FAD/NAD(P)-binding oxidoreductase [Candidatus Binatia bacterium]|nr:FAD/NAD(P)-binding oxidoreductase [Candidatus Binatia bacterium]
MNRLVILGGGTAGTMAANRLRRRLDRATWKISVVDQSDTHHYQPGHLFVPFGIYRPRDVVKPMRRFMPEGVDLILSEVARVIPEENRVLLADDRELPYDYLIIATGASPRPDQTPGMVDGEWRKSIHEFYTLEGAVALGEHLADWEGGRMLVHIVDTPIKCPVAPLEFTLLAEAFFAERGMRDRVDITFVTPLEGAFTKPVASRHLGALLGERGVAIEGDFLVERVDPERKTLVSYDEREIPFDLLVTVPLHMGAAYVGESGIGDELNYVPVDKHTLLAKAHGNIFAIGDASDIPTSKAGSVAHFSMELFEDNFANHVRGRPMTRLFDGHANCFIESGHGKGLLIDFNYDTEPLPGKYPLPGLGPFTLLRETETNHWGKMMFRWVYWNLLLPGKEMPLEPLMSMAGKEVDGRL